MGRRGYGGGGERNFWFTIKLKRVDEAGWQMITQGMTLWTCLEWGPCHGETLLSRPYEFHSES